MEHSALLGEFPRLGKCDRPTNNGLSSGGLTVQLHKTYRLGIPDVQQAELRSMLPADGTGQGRTVGSQRKSRGGKKVPHQQTPMC